MVICNLLKLSRYDFSKELLCSKASMNQNQRYQSKCMIYFPCANMFMQSLFTLKSAIQLINFSTKNMDDNKYNGI